MKNAPLPNPESSPFLPESMLPLVDTRGLAAEICYAKRLSQIAAGLVPEAEDATYVAPGARDFTVPGAHAMVGTVLSYALTQPEHGLVRQVQDARSQELLVKVGVAVSRLGGMSRQDVQYLITELAGHHREAYEAWRVTATAANESGDVVLCREERALRWAGRLVQNLLEPTRDIEEYCKNASLSGNAWWVLVVPPTHRGA
jgi:hypothetical protein